MLRFVSIVLCSVLLVSCGRSGPPAPVTNYGLQVDEGAGVLTVRPDETLWRIAKQHNLPMRDIIDLNRLSPPYHLMPGKRLRLPAPRQYTVREGDTVHNVSRVFGVDVSQMVDLNNLKEPYRLYEGQEVRLPRPKQPKKYSSKKRSVRVATKAISPETPRPGIKPEQHNIAPVSGGNKVASKRQILPARSQSGFMWPVDGQLLSGFGTKPGGLYNDGVNIASPKGTPVRASDHGEVAYVGDSLKSFGNLVLIRHRDGWMSAYAHLGKPLVKRGEMVKRGQAIGVVGKTGAVDRPQLHFELRKGSKAVDPKKHLPG